MTQEVLLLVIPDKTQYRIFLSKAGGAQKATKVLSVFLKDRHLSFQR